jgi:hypothetical protein
LHGALGAAEHKARGNELAVARRIAIDGSDGLKPVGVVALGETGAAEQRAARIRVINATVLAIESGIVGMIELARRRRLLVDRLGDDAGGTGR